MIYLEYQELEPNKAMVTLKHYKPEKLSTERKAKGLIVEDTEIPVADESLGSPVLYLNPQTKELWYEYLEIIKTPTKEEELQNQIDELKAQMAQLLNK